MSLNMPQEKEEKKEKKKLQFLKSIEKPTSIPSEGPPLLLTFPYPYMNGKLHLGHLFTISKAEFFSRYVQMHNYTPLFPFSFHCTGMPICASAQRLKENDPSVHNLLQSLGFADTSKFTDPVHWVNTFIPLAKQSLIKFNCNITWDRSFFTTSLNKVYDTFVTWQFNKLRKKGFLSFGKRYSIFCPKDRQPCLDHDRLQGEGVLPKAVDLLRVPVSLKEGPASLFVPFAIKTEKSGSAKLFYDPSSLLVLFLGDSLMIAEEEVFMNLSYQVNDLKRMREVKWEEIESIVGRRMAMEKRTFTLLEIKEKQINEREIKEREIKEREIKEREVNEKVKEIKESLFKMSLSLNLEQERNELSRIVDSKSLHTLNITDNLLRYYKPESLVVSRSNAKCVVSLLDQWFIDYSREDWKKSAFLCLDRLISDKETKQFLISGMHWIGKWAFSRSFGLGTQVPWDKEYLIDSLSDSTIYPSLYTFYHLLSDNLEGRGIPVEEWMYDYIYQDVLLESSEEVEVQCTCKERECTCLKSTLDRCRALLNETYPVYLRVSGKDLIRNHLLFFILIHVALFKEKYWPKRVETNGHLLLNSCKMSKSTGNFLTVDDVIDKYGESATRMCLAMCGDTNEDADFLEVTANANILKIHGFIESVSKIFSERNEGETIKEREIIKEIIKEIKEEEEREEEKREEEKREEEKREEKINKEEREEDCQSFLEEWLNENIAKNVHLTNTAYKNFTFRDVIKYGFHEMLNSHEKYLSMGGKKDSLAVYSLFTAMVKVLYPIIPSVSVFLNDKFMKEDLKWPHLPLSNKFIPAYEYLQKIEKKIRKEKKKGRIVIKVGKEYPLWKKEVLSIAKKKEKKEMNHLLDREEIPSKNISQEEREVFFKVLDKYGIDHKKGMPFCVSVCVKNDNVFDEYDLLIKNKSMLERVIKREVSVMHGDCEPYDPIIVIE